MTILDSIPRGFLRTFYLIRTPSNKLRDHAVWNNVFLVIQSVQIEFVRFIHLKKKGRDADLQCPGSLAKEPQWPGLRKAEAGSQELI